MKVAATARRRERSFGWFGQGFEIFPKLGVLLGEQRLRDRELVADKKVLERIFMQNPDNMEGVADEGLKIEPVGATTQAVERLPRAVKPAEWLAWVREVGGRQPADGTDGLKLREMVELVQLADTLLGKGDLEHSNKDGQTVGKSSRPTRGGNV